MGFLDSRPTVETIQLEPLRWEGRTVVLANPAIYEIRNDYFRDELVHMLRIELASTRPDVVERSWPTPWRDAFNERWFPTFRKWVPRLFPVERSHIRIERRGVYPEIPLRRGERYTVMHWMKMEEWSRA